MSRIKGFGKRPIQIPDTTLYIVVGSEGFFRDRAVEGVIEQSVAAQDRSASIRRFDAEEATPGKLLAELEAPSLFAREILVVVRDAEALIRGHKDALLRVASLPDLSRRLVLASKESLSKLEIPRALEVKATILECYDLMSGEVARFAMAEAGRWGKRIDRQAAALLEYGVGTDAGGLAGEIEKLAIFVGERRTITTADVEELGGSYRAFDAFELAKFSLSADVAGALRAAERLRQTRTAFPVATGALVSVLERVMGLKRVLEEGAPLDKETLKKIGIFWRDEEAMRRIARLTTFEALEDAVCIAADADAALKRGMVSEETVFEELVMALARGGGAAGSS
ncbi:MAG: DNA polymerase III subunit delta [Planctomycetota bacterium]